MNWKTLQKRKSVPRLLSMIVGLKKTHQKNVGLIVIVGLGGGGGGGGGGGVGGGGGGGGRAVGRDEVHGSKCSLNEKVKQNETLNRNVRTLT